MSILSPITSTSLEVAVSATRAEFGSTMAADQWWMLVSSTACWVKQANPTGLITCVANALMVDGDYMTINDGTTSKLYEYDKAADGVTGGRVAWAAGTTAISVAANLAAAINANRPNSTVVATAVGDGTITLASTSGNLTLTENVGDAGFLVSYTPQATAAALSMYLPANTPVILDGGAGSNVSILRDAADGKASLTRCKAY